MNDLGGAGEALALIAAGVGVLLLALTEGMDQMAKRRRQGQTPEDPPPETPKPDPLTELERDPGTGDRDPEDLPEIPPGADDDETVDRMHLHQPPMPPADRPRPTDPPLGSGIWAPQSRTMWEWT